MIAALHGGFVDYVLYMGMTERYPDWFHREVLDDIYMDEHRYTFWVPEEERGWDYHEKTLVEDFSVFLRKREGEIFCTSQETFENLYYVFRYDRYMNSGVAAYEEDCIEYVECQPGVLEYEYPDWFYEFFTEAVHFPDESIYIYEAASRITSNSTDVVSPLDHTMGQAAVNEHCVFLRNLFGEIRHMTYEDFTRHFDPGQL